MRLTTPCRCGGSEAPWCTLAGARARCGNSDYIASVMGPADAERQKRAQQIVAQVRAPNAMTQGASDAQRQDGGKKDAAMQNGAAIYAGSCAICHGAPQRAPGSPSSNALHLSLSSSLSLPDPGNLMRVILSVSRTLCERVHLRSYVAFKTASRGALVLSACTTRTVRMLTSSVSAQGGQASQQTRMTS